MTHSMRPGWLLSTGHGAVKDDVLLPSAAATFVIRTPPITGLPGAATSSRRQPHPVHDLQQLLDVEARPGRPHAVEHLQLGEVIDVLLGNGAAVDDLRPARPQCTEHGLEVVDNLSDVFGGRRPVGSDGPCRFVDDEESPTLDIDA